MTLKDETKALVNTFSDSSRKIERIGRQFIVPHKFTPDGEVVSKDNYDQKTCLSKLSLDDLRFLSLWKTHKWDDDKTLKETGLSSDQAAKTFKKLAYFKVEDQRIKALAQEATPERVLAKDVENLDTGGLNDSQHKSLDRIAKAAGMFKTQSELTVNHTIQVPKLDPAAWDAIRKIADMQADVIDGEVA